MGIAALANCRTREVARPSVVRVVIEKAASPTVPAPARDAPTAATEQATTRARSLYQVGVACASADAASVPDEEAPGIPALNPAKANMPTRPVAMETTTKMPAAARKDTLVEPSLSRTVTTPAGDEITFGVYGSLSSPSSEMPISLGPMGR
jgi:hypothetical protein